MKIKTEELDKNGYRLLDKLKHNELVVFLKEKNKGPKSFFFYIYLVSIMLPLPILSFLITKNIIEDRIDIYTGLFHCLLGIGLVVLFIPIHELLHALAYKIVGAKKLSFYLNFRKMYFAAISDKSVINLAEFKIVALTPYLFATVMSLFIVFQVNGYWVLTMLSFLVLHSFFCGGDFSLLNYMQTYKSAGIVTFDDKEKRETYFYIKSQVKTGDLLHKQ
jgi:hypothetical protein